MPTDRCPHCGYTVSPSAQTCPQCEKGLSGSALLQDRDTSTTMPALTILLLVVGLGVLALGGVFLSEATMGVGMICGACFLGIWARIVQASAHHTDTMRRR